MHRLSITGHSSNEQARVLSALREAVGLLTSALSERVRACSSWIFYAQKYNADVIELTEACRNRLDLQEFSLVYAKSISHQRQRMIDTNFSEALASTISDCVSFAIRSGYLTEAVELLNQSRAMMFSQLSRYRTALDDLSDSVDPDVRALGDRFVSLGRVLSNIAVSEWNRETVSRREQERHQEELV